jgi:hypothetical protein
MKEAAAKTRQVVVITGASAGIGAALARVFAAHGHDLVLIARREARLDALADEIAATGRPRPLVLPVDLAQPDAAARIKAELAAHALEPQYIVNNAGFGLVGEAAQLDQAEQLTMIDLNIRFLTELSLAFVDTLSRRRGGIMSPGFWSPVQGPSHLAAIVMLILPHGMASLSDVNARALSKLPLMTVCEFVVLPPTRAGGIDGNRAPGPLHVALGACGLDV